MNNADNINTAAGTFDDIADRAAAIGLSLAQLCREAEVSESTIQRWRRGDTDPFRTVRRLDDVLRRHERQSVR